MMEEIWKDIEGYEGKYQVSNLGRVKRLAYTVEVQMPDGRIYERPQKERIIKPCLDSLGRYLIVALHTGKPKTNHLLHRLVAKAFIPNPDNLPIINHIDENTQNNRVDNLEWCDYLYNAQYGDNSSVVEQIDEKGKVIATYKSVREAERLTGIAHESISAICRKDEKRYKAGGFYWRYKK